MSQIEIKEYTEHNTSIEEREMLKKQVYYYKDDVIVYKEIPLTTTFAHELFFEKLKELIKQDKLYFLLIDLRDVSMKKPSSELRATIKKFLSQFKDQIVHCCVVLNSNAGLLLKMGARIIIGGAMDSFSIHSNMDEATGKIIDIKQQTFIQVE